MTYSTTPYHKGIIAEVDKICDQSNITDMALRDQIYSCIKNVLNLAATCKYEMYSSILATLSVERCEEIIRECPGIIIDDSQRFHGDIRYHPNLNEYYLFLPDGTRYLAPGESVYRFAVKPLKSELGISTIRLSDIQEAIDYYKGLFGYQSYKTLEITL